MKKQFLFTALISLISLAGFSQWSGETSTTTGAIYRTGYVGIGTTNVGSPLTLSHPGYSISSSGTNYVIGNSTDILYTYSIPNGVTESGYRMGMYLRSFVNSPNFLGTLNQQIGMRIQFGSYNSSGAGTINYTYGLYLEGLESGSATLNNKYAIYQTGANFKNYFAGNVGIGTTTPSEKLEIYNSATTPGVISLRSARGDAGYVDVGRICAKQGTTEVARIGLPRAGETYSGYITFWTKSDNSSSLTESVRINREGKVGINTTNPTSTLTVNGDIEAEKVTIIADVPSSDYVFDKNYNLPLLKDVEQFVNENKHLPEIPSATEFKENGYSVGQMDDLLLRKVEELTLYTINQDKQIAEQGEQNKMLIEKIDEKDALIQEMLKRIEALEKK